MFVYGLTGGIGSGKSTIAEMFGSSGIPSFDADQIGRQLTDEGTRLTKEVLEQFPDCADSPDRIDRQKLAEHVFTDQHARLKLEAIMHPAIWKEFKKRKANLPAPQPPACLIEGAVILESQSAVWQQAMLAGLIVVTAPESIRIKRICNRDGIDENQAKKRMKSQLPQHEKILKATHLIDNANDLAATRRQVESVRSLLIQECGGQA
jgi:dephospho-CoA kinase